MVELDDAQTVGYPSAAGGEVSPGTPLLTPENIYLAALKAMSPDELRKEFCAAAEYYEYCGGHWTYVLAQDEMRNRGLLS